VEQYVSFLLAALVGFLLAGLTWLAARKSGLQPAQAALISTLQDNADALGEQVKILREQLAAEVEQRQALERKVARLREAVVDLASENAELRGRLGMPRRPAERSLDRLVGHDNGN
jgi:chromosome segregation ATPase